MNPFQEDANDPQGLRPHTPPWVPGWCPSGESLDYVKRALTVALLVLVGAYVLTHMAKGRTGTAAPLAAAAT